MASLHAPVGVLGRQSLTRVSSTDSHLFPSLGRARIRRASQGPTVPAARRSVPRPVVAVCNAGDQSPPSKTEHKVPVTNCQGPSQSQWPGSGEDVPQTPSVADTKLRRRSLALFLPLVAAVSATSRAAAQVATTEQLDAPPADVAAPPESAAAPPPAVAPASPSTLEPAPPKAPSKISLKILEGCTLGVSFYPDFEYNPKGGGGEGTVSDLGDGRLAVTFDPSSLNIPPLSFDSTTFVGLPLPPPLKITIVPFQLSGVIDKRSGQVDLVFKSKFYFTAGPVYSAPPLTVETILTTESSVGNLREGYGSRLNSAGQATLAAVAVVPPVRDRFLDRFLSLPTEVLAVLPAQFAFEA